VRSVLRTVWVTANGLTATMILGPLAIFIALLGFKGPIFSRMSRLWCRWILWASATPIYVQGMEHIAPDRPQIFVSNHQSWYDVFALGATVPKHFRFVAKKELGLIPVFGQAWKLAGHISIDRGDRQKAIESLRAAGEALRRDSSAVIIFPEGTRSRSGALQAFKKGAFMLALGTGVEIVPTAVVGSREVMRKGDWRVHSRPIILRFGEPVETVAYGDDARDELVEAVRTRVLTLFRGEPAGAVAHSSGTD
jgi:1-acyl-sn-glycerol-3-phosphate acyltransferase